MKRVLGLSLFVASCAAHAPVPAPRPAMSSARWEFVVHTLDGGKKLDISATIPAGYADEFTVDDGAAPFVKKLTASDAHAPIPTKDGNFVVPGCKQNGCRLTYEFALEDAAGALESEDTAKTIVGSNAFLASPPAFLVHPTVAPVGHGYRIVGDDQFHTGIFPLQTNEYVGDISDLEDAPYSAFGALDRDVITVAGSTVELRMPPKPPAIGRARLVKFVDRAANAVAAYLGRFPVSRVLLVIAPVPGKHIKFGKTLGGGGASIVLFVGQDATEDDLANDWVLVHELTHLAVPSMDRNHSWFTEGIATYVEPLERVRAGLHTEKQTLAELVEGLPQGEPMRGDEGLDHTPTWGRTYWGGALFCFQAELAIRDATHGKKGLRDALAAIVAQGGSIAVRWSMEKTLGVGDDAVGARVLVPLYDAWKDKPVSVDLLALFKTLGVGDDGVVDDSAPRAKAAHQLFE